MKKFNDKYRIPRDRASWWDYSNNGVYFVSICTKNRTHFFGDIVDGTMHLSEIGIMADALCTEFENQFTFAEIDEFIIMPNHVHLIVIIN